MPNTHSRSFTANCRRWCGSILVSLLLLMCTSLLALESAVVLVSAQPTTFNVADYGARGDGQTDDTVAVLSALQALLSTPTGTSLVFPAGTFLLESPPSPSPQPQLQPQTYMRFAAGGTSNAFTVSGAGPFQTTLVFQQSLGTLIAADGVQLSVSNLGIRLKQNDTAPAQGPEVNAIAMVRCQQCSINSVAIDHASFVGAAVSLGPDVETAQVASLQISNSGETGIEVEGVDSLTVTEVTIDGTHITSQFSQYGLRISAGGSNWQFTGLTLQNLLNGLAIWGASSDRSIGISRSTVHNIGMTGMSFGDNSTVALEQLMCENDAGLVSTCLYVGDTGSYATNVHVSCDQCTFRNQNYGVEHLSGHANITNSLFVNNNIGYSFVSLSASSPPGPPFSLLWNKFTQQQIWDIDAENSGGWIIAGNTCTDTNPGRGSIIKCEGQCVVENNSGCTGLENASEGKSENNTNGIAQA